MTTQETELIVSYRTLRQMIGYVGLLMPLSVRVGARIFEHISTSNSISAYYYTGMRDVLVSTLVLSGTLLSFYRTPARRDAIAAVIAGLAAIGIGLFPMDPNFAKEVLERYPEMATDKCYVNRGILGYHFLFVATFFAVTFYLVYFRFRAFTPPIPTAQKKKRNLIYRLCGICMLIGFAWIGALVMSRDPSIFWPEALVVVSFSAAWLVKGQVVLRDKPNTA
jgi:hypothetical protein